MQAYIDTNGVTNGTNPGNRAKRCHEGQASDAFLWFLFASYAVSAVLSAVGSRGNIDLRGPRRPGPGPSVSKV